MNLVISNILPDKSLKKETTKHVEKNPIFVNYLAHFWRMILLNGLWHAVCRKIFGFGNSRELLQCFSFGWLKRTIFGRLKYVILGKLQYFSFQEIEIFRCREIKMCHFRKIEISHFRDSKILQFSWDQNLSYSRDWNVPFSIDWNVSL